MTLDQCKKYNKQIGSKIKTLREEQGISQAELAEKSGISTTYLSLWKMGKETILHYLHYTCLAMLSM